MSKQNRRYIAAVLDLATPSERAEGLAWYTQANSIARILADRYETITPAQAIGVIAALSPRNRWERNCLDAEQLIAAYVSGGLEAAEEVKVCTFSVGKAKAVKILGLAAGYQGMTQVLDVLSGPKLREFASCIAGFSDVCIDGHAYCIWANDRRSLKDVPAIGVKLRREIKADYMAVANERGLHPWQAQAISWVTWRRLHGVTPAA